MCTITASEIQADGMAVSNALLAVAKIEAAISPTLAANLTTAAQALLAVTSTWTSTSAITLFNDAATAAEIALAAIPETAAIAPLIPIAIAALDILMAQLPTSPAAGKVAAKLGPKEYKAMNDRIAAYAFTHPNPYRLSVPTSILIHHAFMRSPRDDFRAAWNSVAKAHPDLAGARI
jgi:hypothetical protein